jgi:hypothetical protein
MINLCKYVIATFGGFNNDQLVISQAETSLNEEIVFKHLNYD